MGKKLAGAINVLLTAILAILAVAFPMKIATALHENGGDLNTAGYIVIILPIFALAFVIVQRKKLLRASLVVYCVALILGMAIGLFDAGYQYGVNELYLLFPCLAVIVKMVLLKKALIKEGKSTTLINKTPVVTVGVNEVYDLSKIPVSYSVWHGVIASFYDSIEVFTVRLPFGKGLSQKHRMVAFSYDQIVACHMHKKRRRGIAVDAYEDIYVQLDVKGYKEPAVYVSFLEGSHSELGLLTNKALSDADQFCAKINLILKSKKKYHRY